MIRWSPNPCYLVTSPKQHCSHSWTRTCLSSRWRPFVIWIRIPPRYRFRPYRHWKRWIRIKEGKCRIVYWSKSFGIKRSPNSQFPKGRMRQVPLNIVRFWTIPISCCQVFSTQMLQKWQCLIKISQRCRAVDSKIDSPKVLQLWADPETGDSTAWPCPTTILWNQISILQ